MADGTSHLYKYWSTERETVIHTHNTIHHLQQHNTPQVDDYLLFDLHKFLYHILVFRPTFIYNNSCAMTECGKKLQKDPCPAPNPRKRHTKRKRHPKNQGPTTPQLTVMPDQSSPDSLDSVSLIGESSSSSSIISSIPSHTNSQQFLPPVSLLFLFNLPSLPWYSISKEIYKTDALENVMAKITSTPSQIKIT